MSVCWSMSLCALSGGRGCDHFVGRRCFRTPFRGLCGVYVLLVLDLLVLFTSIYHNMERRKKTIRTLYYML